MRTKLYGATTAFAPGYFRGFLGSDPPRHRRYMDSSERTGRCCRSAHRSRVAT